MLDKHKIFKIYFCKCLKLWGKLKHKNKAINNELHPIMLNAYNYFNFLKNEQKKRKEIFPQTHNACWQASEVQKHLALCIHYYNI